MKARLQKLDVFMRGENGGVEEQKSQKKKKNHTGTPKIIFGLFFC